MRRFQWPIEMWNWKAKQFSCQVFQPDLSARNGSSRRYYYLKMKDGVDSTPFLLGKVIEKSILGDIKLIKAKRNSGCIEKKKETIKKPCLTGFLRIAYTSSTKYEMKDRSANMKRNLPRLSKNFIVGLTLPFTTKKPSRIQVLKRMNRILTLVMPGVYGMVFCWLFLKKTSLGGILAFIWIPASGFVLFSLFRHWVNVPRPYEKWEIQPLLEKKFIRWRLLS